MPKTEVHLSFSPSTHIESLSSMTQAANKDCDGEGIGETEVLLLIEPHCNFLFYCLFVSWIRSTKR